MPDTLLGIEPVSIRAYKGLVASREESEEEKEESERREITAFISGYVQHAWAHNVLYIERVQSHIDICMCILCVVRYVVHRSV